MILIRSRLCNCCHGFALSCYGCQHCFKPFLQQGLRDPTSHRTVATRSKLRRQTRKQVAVPLAIPYDIPSSNGVPRVQMDIVLLRRQIHHTHETFSKGDVACENCFYMTDFPRTTNYCVSCGSDRGRQLRRKGEQTLFGRKMIRPCCDAPNIQGKLIAHTDGTDHSSPVAKASMMLMQRRSQATVLFTTIYVLMEGASGLSGSPHPARTAFASSVLEFALRVDSRGRRTAPVLDPRGKALLRTRSTTLLGLKSRHGYGHDHSERTKAMRFHTSNDVSQTFKPVAETPQKRQGDVQVGNLMVDGLRTFYKTVLPTNAVAGAHPLVLVHGFGISSDHFDKNMHEIADATGAPVHAIDLIGFGRSEKPGKPVYGIDLWQRQLEVFLDDVVQANEVLLAGNSIGGYVCMNVAADRPSQIAGLSLINSAGTWGAINPLGVPMPWLAWRPVARALGRMLFNAARKPEHVARTLQRVYVDKSRVDEALLESILSPSRTPEAEVAGPALFCSLFLAPVGRTWEQLLGGTAGYKGPTIALWGDKDPWLHSGFVGLLSGLRSDLEVRWIHDSGHCPHHERPDLFNQRLSEWILRLRAQPEPSRYASAIQAEVDRIEAEVHSIEVALRPAAAPRQTFHWDTPGSTWTAWEVERRSL